ncbi:hypothetical protein BRADI_3g23920v3 [Brachypodium distachyon]|uniref:Uncharacterized protein n=1 Tax=Brachypodium distachyon TaxID=15368 RepID=A0A0Q3FEB1_BRADI|nr:hypothetical protein BRADI_3g23920v3 [Brachypodium distachyon]
MAANLGAARAATDEFQMASLFHTCTAGAVHDEPQAETPDLLRPSLYGPWQLWLARRDAAPASSVPLPVRPLAAVARTLPLRTPASSVPWPSHFRPSLSRGRFPVDPPRESVCPWLHRTVDVARDLHTRLEVLMPFSVTCLTISNYY